MEWKYLQETREMENATKFYFQDSAANKESVFHYK